MTEGEPRPGEDAHRTQYDGSNLVTTGTIPAGYQPGGGETYPVHQLTEKPLWQSVANAYQ